MDAMLIVDMQVGLLNGPPKYELPAVLDRINQLAAMVRRRRGDGHTLSDRPHLDAPTVRHHHNWVWSNLISPRSIQVLNTAELLTLSCCG
jgi:hypothetical protein